MHEARTHALTNERKHMAQDANDKKTQDLFTTEEKDLMAQALKTHAEKVGRKASADAPATIRELWRQELQKIEELARKVLK